MDPAQWIQVLMTVIFINHGNVVYRFEEMITTAKCQDTLENAAVWNEKHKGGPDYFNWGVIGVQTDAQIQVRCREDIGKRVVNS